MKKEDALKLVFDCLAKCEKKTYSPESVDVGIVSEGKFNKLSVQQINDMIKKLG